MSIPTLTIRNLTSTPLELNLIERYQAPATSSNPGYFNLTSGHSSVSTAEQIAMHSEHFESEEVSIDIQPFARRNTDVKTSHATPDSALRLTFECDGHKHRLETLALHEESQRLTPLSQNARIELSSHYIHSIGLLAIYPATDLSSWMSRIPNSTPVSALSIPGTHNSPTYHKALPSVRCQSTSIRDQLANGIRFLDIRVQPSSATDSTNSGLVLVHGVFPVSLTGPKHFTKSLTEILSFLTTNPTETIILSMKREGAGNATDAHLSKILHDHYTSTTESEKWYTEPRIPRLVEVRGKIVLLRRFALHDSLRSLHDGQGWGLNAENWAYNTANDTHGDVCVQDFCEVLDTTNIEAKIRYCCEHFERAGKVVCPVPGVNTDEENPIPVPPLYLNFLSGSNFWKRGCWPDRIAKVLNPEVVKWILDRHDLGGGPGERELDGSSGDGGVGIVVCDYVGAGDNWDLVKCIVAMNAKLQAKV